MLEIENQDFDWQKAEGKKWHYEQLARKCIPALERNHVKGYFAAARAEAKAKILELIPDGATIGVGDSLSIFQTGVLDVLEDRGHQIFNPFKSAKGYFATGGEERFEVMRRALTADVFLCGTNALTLDGKLVCTDQLGNRVAGLIFGPKKCIVAAGANKIVKDVDEALVRIKEVAAPQVVKWHNTMHGMENVPPCGITGTCSNCHHANKVCIATVILDGECLLSGKFHRERLHVVIVGEELGF